MQLGAMEFSIICQLIAAVSRVVTPCRVMVDVKEAVAMMQVSKHWHERINEALNRQGFLPYLIFSINMLRKTVMARSLLKLSVKEDWHLQVATGRISTCSVRTCGKPLPPYYDQIGVPLEPRYGNNRHSNGDFRKYRLPIGAEARWFYNSPWIVYRRCRCPVAMVCSSECHRAACIVRGDLKFVRSVKFAVIGCSYREPVPFDTDSDGFPSSSWGSSPEPPSDSEEHRMAISPL